MMNGHQLRALREQRGWTQQQAAKRLHVTQPYLSMLESGRRPASPRLRKAMMRVFGLSPTALPLPAVLPELSDSQVAGDLGALGYPGFRHLALRSRPRQNPAAVLAAALAKPTLASRLVEALPWLALEYADLDWDWLTRQAKLRDFQNRLGYVVLLARRLAERAARPDAAGRLGMAERALARSRLAQEDSFAGDALTAAERRWLRKHRPPEARYWNLLTDLTPDQLHHAS